MPRALCVSITIVAAFQLQLAAASTVEDAVITPSVAALAVRLDVDPSNDRSRFMADMARALYASPGAKPPTFGSVGPLASRPAGGTSVPVPLPAAVWSQAVFQRAVPSDELVAAVLSDRRAALLCAGLSGLDDETLAYLIEHPAIVTMLYERGSAAFAAFGESLRIRAGRVEAPGGAESTPLWEAVALVPLGDPERFARMLFVEYDGRLAYLLSVIAAAEPEAARFALGLWMPDPVLRAARFKVLFDTCVRGYEEWRVSDYPFSRPIGDLALLLFRVRVTQTGTPTAPASRTFWASVFDVGTSASAGAEAGVLESIDAAWLAEAVGGLHMYARVERLDEFAFGQRVFHDAPASANDAVVRVLRSFRRSRMLMLTFERMGILTPSVYVAALERADAIDDLDSSRRFWTYAQFQGGLSLVERMRRHGTIDRARGEALVMSLVAVPFQEGVYGGGVAQWVRTQLANALPPDGTWEDRVIAASAGRVPSPDAPRLFWEGQAYRVDASHADGQRMRAIRRKQGGHTLDLAIAIDGVGRSLRSGTLTLEDVGRARFALRSMAEGSSSALRHPAVHLLPPGVTPPRDGLLWLGDASGDLAKIVRDDDLSRAARVGASLQQLAEIALGEALLSLAYAADMGDPDSAALLAGNVALRHDFGLARRDADGRGRAPWAQPRQDFQPGVPWHVAGSLLGLDVALAPLALRRLSIDRPGAEPRISSIERDALALDVALLDRRRLTDSDRAAILETIGRGRERVARIAAGTDSVDTAVDELGLDGWRRRSLVWSLRDPGTVASQFSLVELVWLGGGAGAADLDAWGTAALYSHGCICTRFPSARAWRVLAGRSQLPLMASAMADLNLALAAVFQDLGVPSALVPSVLSFAMQEFIDEVSGAGGGDWRRLVQSAQNLRRQRVEDYVSATSAVDGPLVPEEDPALPSTH